MSEGRLPKPNLRNLQASKARGNFLQLALSCIAVGAAYKFLVADVTQRRIEEFYKTYDPDAALKVMNDAGLMHSAPQ
ncbi:cytochrome c oxidase subunit cyclope [Nomia melanderi]|uniref:cytochrome c oxidase subunit cyclope n=1 Tax=Nomia melanderi TaxID=2448451 RepID=UPI003FCEDB36